MNATMRETSAKRKARYYVLDQRVDMRSKTVRNNVVAKIKQKFNVQSLRWSQTCGCSCGCSPGFVSDDQYGVEVYITSIR